MDEKMKKISDSLTEQAQILMPADINGNKRLFGGRLMEWIDIVAAVVARRHSNSEVTTASVDNLQFKQAAYINSTIILKGKMTYVGKTSMEVKVDTYVEDLSGERSLVNSAYLVMVALDLNNKPKSVPTLILETEEDIKEWESGKRRHELRKQRRLENF
ncbi:MAG: thioesterase superfamily protein [Clostridia bacterium]|jgi:acyl-CoA hydrolase|nr:thioesterase superfamily protein [Clostridia bacterium]